VKVEPFEMPSVVYWIREIDYKRVNKYLVLKGRLNSDPLKESQSPFLCGLASLARSSDYLRETH
jgi:hypothetical protein